MQEHGKIIKVAKIHKLLLRQEKDNTNTGYTQTTPSNK